MRHYICERCNTEYDAFDKYELSENVAYIDFGEDIDEYQEIDDGINIIFQCQACHELEDDSPNDPKDIRE
jgi:cytochrome c2